MNPTSHPSDRITPTSASLSGSGSSERISDEIEVTRSRMDETLDELGDRLNPRRIMDDVMDYFTRPSGSSGGKSSATARFGDSASEFGQNLGRTLRDNPVPTALIGAGLAWLAFGFGHDDSEEDRPRRRLKRDCYNVNEYDDDDESYMADEDYALQPRFADDQYQGNEHELVLPESYTSGSDESDDPSMWEKTKHAAAGAVDSVTGAAASVGDAIGDATNATASGISSAASSVASGASAAGTATSGAAAAAVSSSRRAGRSAYRYGRRAGRGVGRQGHNLSESVNDLAAQASDKYQQACERYPLAVGAGCMALGMLAGLVVPRTRREDQWMGKASDDFVDDAYEAGERLVQRGKRVASETIDEAAASSDEHGLTGDSLVERGKRVATKVVDAASEALVEEDLTAEKLASDAKSVVKETGAKVNQEADQAIGDAKAKAAKVDPDVKQL